MDRIFDIYLAKQDQPESDAYAELFLPATPYQMQDAFDKLRLAEDESLYWEITEYHHFEELSSFLNGACDLNDLNALAQRLSELDERQCTAFAGLLKMEQKKGEEIPISRLIDLAYSTDCCHVVDEALNDSQLGRFCAENGFVPEAETLPDHVFDLLDFERIGREHRQREGGILVERTADHPGGYVEQRDELLEVYKTLDLTPKAPEYIFRMPQRQYCLLSGRQSPVKLVVDQTQVDISGLCYAVNVNGLIPMLDRNGVPHPDKPSEFPVMPVAIGSAAVLLIAVAVVMVSKGRKKAVNPQPEPQPAPRPQPIPQPQPVPRAPVLCSMAAQHGGTVIPLTGQSILIGRDISSCRLTFKDGTPGVSSRHCTVSWDQMSSSFVLTDMKSTYGTFLHNGQKLAPGVPCQLKPGDSFYLGEPANALRVELR